MSLLSKTIRARSAEQRVEQKVAQMAVRTAACMVVPMVAWMAVQRVVQRVGSTAVPRVGRSGVRMVEQMVEWREESTAVCLEVGWVATQEVE